jgi:hypothetical protein
MPLPAITSLGAPEIKSIGKILLCAWSAEYALRINPLVQDAEYARTSLALTFPQAYYAAFFSARAVLASDGIHLANHNGVNQADESTGRCWLLRPQPDDGN